MAYQRTSQYEHSTEDPGDQALHQNDPNDSIKAQENHEESTGDRKTSPFLKVGPTWAEAKREWQHGSKTVVALFFMTSFLLGTCVWRGVYEIIVGCGTPFWPGFITGMVLFGLVFG